MRFLKRTIAGISIVLATACSSYSSEWRGIKPLHSKLADVVRQFGRCTTSTSTSCTYAWKDETVTFVFLANTCGAGKQKLPRRTIVRIERRPKTATRLPDYHKISLNNYLAFFVPAEGPSRRFENYVDDEEGFAIEAENDSVTEVHYTAAAAEATLCPASYVKPSELLPVHEPKQLLEFFCPGIAVSCPDKTVEADEPIVFFASLAGGYPYTEPTYKWSITGGRILSGPDAFSLQVETKGLADGTEITATLTVDGLPPWCARQASCTTRIKPYRVPLGKPSAR